MRRMCGYHFLVTCERYLIDALKHDRDQNPCRCYGPSRILIAMPKKHAVIVGVADYAKAQVADLEYSPSDAQRLASTLIDHCDFARENVKLFADPSDLPSPDARSPQYSDILAA